MSMNALFVVAFCSTILINEYSLIDCHGLASATIVAFSLSLSVYCSQ